MIDAVWLGFGLVFSAGASLIAAGTVRARVRLTGLDVAFLVFVACACIYLAAHSFLAGLPIA